MRNKATTLNLFKLSMTAALITVLLSGCLYPQSDSSPSDAVSKEAIRNVQGAVEQYLSEKSILPVHNSDSSVDRYEKFRINFDLLKQEGYIDMLPRSSFEGGGNFYFLILNEDTEPVVKAQSIYLSQKIIDLQRQVDDYAKQNGQLPADEQLYEGFSTIDYAKLKLKTPELHSVYSGSIVQLMLSDSGKVYINYASDIYQAMLANPEVELAEDADLRELLVLGSDYVPVKSPKYRLLNDEPVPYE